MARIRHNGNGVKKKQPPPHAKTPAHPEHDVVTEENQSANQQTDKRANAAGAQLPPIFRGFADTTSHVVKQAASILEEEIAAGILAARQIENKFIDTDELRSGKSDEVLQRFRRDAHEVVDIVVDIVGATARNATRMAKRAISIRGGERSTGEGASTSVLTMPQPVKAGQTGEVSLVVENDGESTVEPFEFRPTDLVSASGDRIPEDAVRFDPKVISVGSHQNQRVAVRVTPPADTPPGTYSGLIQSSRPDLLRAVLTIIVA
jgi:hypothetical protein